MHAVVPFTCARFSFLDGIIQPRMALSPGTKLGPYEIQSPLGAGGMGEVYRARDTRLDRTVAIKVLPSHLSSNAAARQRFDREARAISSLSHQNICQLYDVGSQDGTDFLVMEYLEGETLADRLAKGPLPLPQLLKCGMEICEGLEKAHRSGVVHRDLKPGNIMLTKSGAKLMDFGLAKPTAASAATAATLDAKQPLTAEGSIVGTFHYMSPEQVEGRELDARSDIFSFGAVLYEMVTGKRAFDGKSQMSVASAILEKEPEPITTIQPLAPPALDHVVRGCLAKDPESRWQSAGDIARELQWITTGSSSASAVAAPARLRRKARERFVWGAVVAALLAALVWSGVRERPQPHVVRAYLPAPEATTFDFVGDYAGPPVVSPDGARIAFCARAQDISSIWVQTLDSGIARKLDGTEKASDPFWSPDGKFIGFFADGKLKKIPSVGGATSVIADAPNPRGGAWSKANFIVYAPDYRDTLWKISAAGGTPQRATILDAAKHSTHRWPSFLPDGKNFLFYATNHAGGRADQNGIYFASLDTGDAKLILATDSAGQYASGHLLFHLQSVLAAQKFDPVAGKLSGEPVPVADHVQYDVGTWHTSFTASDDGILVYEPGSASSGLDLVWMDRTGKLMGTVGERDIYRGMRLSPDGRRLAVSIGDPRPDIWIFDLARGIRRRLTFDDATHFMPSWSSDGQRVAFMTQSGGGGNFSSDLHAKAANGGGQDELLMRPDQAATAFSWPQWSPDGRFLIYQRSSGPSGDSVWAVPISGEKKPFLVAQPEGSQASIVRLRLSPDGRWLAYSSTDSGRQEVYVTAFPSGSGRWQVSQNGGLFPVWRGDSQEIYFIATDSPIRLFAASVKAKGSEFQVESVRPLFPVPNVAAIGELFDVTPDGSRFLLPVPPKAGSPPMILVLNWTADLKKE
jgi:Tol biopolymer transport system component/predicted Ser/Thr protein kinase